MICNPVNEKDRFYLNKRCNREEMDDLRLTLIKIQCATACLNPENIPHNCDTALVKTFIEKALDIQATARWLEEDWWIRMIEKYRLPKACYIDFEKLEFYTRKEL